MIEVEPEYTEQDFETKLKKGHASIARAQYDQAIQAYEEARTAALALKKMSDLDDLDNFIRRSRDQAKRYQQMKQIASKLAQETETANQVEGLVSLNRMIGQSNAMKYHELARLAYEMRKSIINSLSSGDLFELADVAKEQGEYELTLALLRGIQSAEGTQIYDLKQRVTRTWEGKIAPRLAEAESYLTQARPLDGLGSLQDLRRELPACQSWRELWFALCQEQGTGLLEKGRQKIGFREYGKALTLFKKAYRAFAQGGEAYPDTSSTQMLLTEAMDLLEIVQRMNEAHSLQQANEEDKAFQKFTALQEYLVSLAKQKREYSLIQHGVELRLERLEKELGQKTAASIVLDQAKQFLETGDEQRARVYLEQFINYPEPVRNGLAAEYQKLQKQLEENRQSSPEAAASKKPEGPSPASSTPVPEMESSEPSAADPSVTKFMSASSKTGDRLMQWLIYVEPVLARARAAFMRGDWQKTIEHFETLARDFDAEQVNERDDLLEQTNNSSGGDKDD